MNTIKEINRLNQRELERVARTGSIHKGSWHDDYKHSPYIFVGGLPFELNEGDLLSIFSQYGNIIDVDLAREPSKTAEPGKSKGFAFIAYEDQRSTILAVDNFNGIKILGRMLRVDHCSNYKKRHIEKDTADRSACLLDSNEAEEILVERKRRNELSEERVPHDGVRIRRQKSDSYYGRSYYMRSSGP